MKFMLPRPWAKSIPTIRGEGEFMIVEHSIALSFVVVVDAFCLLHHGGRCILGGSGEGAAWSSHSALTFLGLLFSPFSLIWYHCVVGATFLFVIVQTPWENRLFVDLFDYV